MATTIEQQVVLDEAPVPSTKRLRIGRSNFRLPSDIQSKESTLQVVYDVLRRCPFFQAFLVTADVPRNIHAGILGDCNSSSTLNQIQNEQKKHIINLETFRDMLHVCPRVPGQSFDELPFEVEILEFLRFLRHSDEIRTLTDIEHKKQKKGIEMYYPRFTKVVIHHFMSKDLSIPRRNKVNWHYVRDDNIFLTIKVVSTHQDTQQYGAILLIELMNEDIKNTTAYKEYYACATGVAAPKPKASARKKRGDSDTSLTPPIATPTLITTAAPVPRLSADAKGKQPAKAKSSSDLSKAARTEAEQLKIFLKRSRQETYISQHGGSSTDEGTDVDAQDEGDKNDESDDGSDDGNDDDNDDEEELAKIDEPEDTESSRGGDEVTKSEGDSDKDEIRQEEEESFDPIPRTPEGSKDEGNDEEDQDLRLSEEARIQEEEEADELYRDVDINQGRGLQVSQNIEDSHVTLTPIHPDGLQESSPEEESFDPIPRTPEGSKDEGNDEEDQDLRLSEEARKQKEEEEDELYRDVDINQGRGLQLSQNIEDSHVTLTPVHPDGVESIFMTVSSPIVSLQTPTPIMTPSTIATIITSSDAPIPPTTIPSTILENLPTFDSVFPFDERLKTLETTFSEYRQTNLFVDAVSAIPDDLSEMELKKILIEKMEGNKSIQRLDEQRNLYKRNLCRLPVRWRNPHIRCLKQVPKINPLFKPAQGNAQLGVDTLTPELLAGPTYELMRGSCNSLTKLEYHLEEVYKATTDQLDWVNPEDNDLEYLRGGSSSRKYTTSVTKTKAADYGHIKWIEDLMPINWESALDVYSKRRIIAVTELKIVEWHNYKHLDWISEHCHPEVSGRSSTGS
nr:hypothetical protein [Tanacetum cinerariifolium]